MLVLSLVLLLLVNPLLALAVHWGWSEIPCALLLAEDLGKMIAGAKSWYFRPFGRADSDRTVANV